MLPLFVLVGCTPKSFDTDSNIDSIGSTDTDTDTDTDQSVDTDTDENPQGDCPNLESIAMDGDTIPGETMVLTPVGDIDGAELTWSVTSGDLTASETDATWVLDDELAIYVSETATVDLSASLSGCETVSVSEVVTVDYPEAHRLVLITNSNVEGSVEVAEYYAEFRDVPTAHICDIPTEEMTTLDGDDLSDFATALESCLEAIGLHIQILVPVYGVPYKVTGRIEDIAGTGDIPTTSLDALLFLGPSADLAETAIYNPLYQDGSSMEAEYNPYLPMGELLADAEDTLGVPLFAVTRIDGVDAAAAMDLVDRAEEAQALADAGELVGTVYVDGRYGDTEPTEDEFGSYDYGEWNMWGTRYIFEDLALYDVVWDGDDAEFGTEPAPTECPDALYYAGWYSYNNYNDAFTWAPGAIGGHLDSCSACSFRSSTSWSANALQKGITATFGAVGEPYVAGMPEYDQFFLYLLQGANYAEAAYESTVVGLWMMAWLGDPLYRPYPEGVIE